MIVKDNYRYNFYQTIVIRLTQNHFSKGKEVAESSRQHVEPRNELAIGKKIREYQYNPQETQLRMDAGGAGKMLLGPIERKHGEILDRNVQSGK